MSSPLSIASVEDQQRRALRRTRRLATALLAVMAALLVATRLEPEPGFWILLLRAGTEAALVGGLADWFAVTALFRHPLGIPIPHTAIVRTNKNRIGTGLGGFVERNFLAPDLVAGKLRSLGLADRLSHWLAEPRHALGIADRIVSAIPYVLGSVQDREVRGLVRRALYNQFKTIDLAPVLGSVLAVLTESGHHRELFDKAVAAIRRALATNAPRIYRLVSEHSAWYIPPSIDRAITLKIISGLEELLDSLGQQDHEARIAFEKAVAQVTENLQSSPAYRDKIHTIKDQFLRNATVRDYFGSVWDELRRLILQDVTSSTSTLHRAIVGAVQSLGQTLQADLEMKKRLDARIISFVVTFVVPKRVEIGRFIAEVVTNWDARTVSDRLELAVGRDLQYIRINGTLVGALVGCLLFLASRWSF